MTHMPAGQKANDMDAYWMPFTANRQFKAHPRLIVGADGMYFKTSDGRDLLDGIAGLWCCNAGHNRPAHRGGDSETGGGTRLCSGLPDGPPETV